jgi:hypothetical protein
MTLEVEIVNVSDAAGYGSFPGVELDDFVEQTHRRLVRQELEEIHRAEYIRRLSGFAGARVRSRVPTLG